MASRLMPVCLPGLFATEITAYLENNGTPGMARCKAVTLLGIEVVQLISLKWIFVDGPH